MLQLLMRLFLVVLYPPLFMLKNAWQRNLGNTVFAPWQTLRSQFEDVDYYNELHWVIRLAYTAGYWFVVYQILMAFF